jgi:hypothetical protein
MSTNNIKHCPINRTKCIEASCKFWLEITRVDPGPIQGISKTTVSSECGILIGVSILGAIANKPPVIMAQPVRPNILGGS